MLREGLQSSHQDRPNSLLLSARDSYKLSKRRIGAKAPDSSEFEADGYLKKCVPGVRWAISGGLSPIADCSPPTTSMWSLNKQYEPSPIPSPKSKVLVLRRDSEDSGVGVARTGGKRDAVNAEQDEACASLRERVTILERRVSSLEEYLCDRKDCPMHTKT